MAAGANSKIQMNCSLTWMSCLTPLRSIDGKVEERLFHRIRIPGLGGV